jgi:CRISPR-associated protein Cas5h
MMVMNMKYCVVFTIKSDYARFIKHLSASSALTYLIIHPLAAKGLVGNMLGIEKEELKEFNQDIKVGIQVISPIQKETKVLNQVNKKDKDNLNALPSRVDFIKNPQYRLFILSRDKLKLQQLVENLREETYKDIPSLGCSEYPAKIEFEGFSLAKAISPGIHQVSSVIPVNKIKLHWDKDGMDIHLENIPVKGYGKKEHIEFHQVLFKCNQEVLKGVVLDNIYQVNNKNIFFF